MHGFGLYLMAVALDEARRADETATRRPPSAAEPPATLAEIETRAARWRAWAREEAPGPGRAERPIGRELPQAG